MEKSDNQELLNAYLSSDICKRYFSGQKKEGIILLRFETGEYIINNRPSAYLHLLMQGRCNIRIFLANGKSVILRTLKAPCLIGEMELLSEVGSYCVQVLEDCYTLSLPLVQYKEALLDDIVFLRRVCDDLVRKERIESSYLIQSFAYPLKNRLANFILENRQGRYFRIRKVMIAESLGVSERHVSNIMNGFVQKRYLRKNRITYEIINESALYDLSEELQLQE